MGGRGSSFLLPVDDNSQWSGAPNTERANAEMRDALGEKGKPKSIGDAVVATNPYHSREYKEFAYNCQRCVVAYELRRRGYDVEAQATYRGDRLPRIAYLDPKTGARMARWQGAFRNAKTVHVGVDGSTKNAEKAVISNIEKQMHQYGSGSRAVIQVLWRNGGGHVFNVENQGGRIVWVEAQTGRMRDPAETMSHAKTGTIDLVRTDNLKLSGRITQFVRQNTRKR